MATQQFTIEDEPAEAKPAKSGWLKGCLIGCLGLVVILVIVGGIVAFWASRNWRRLLSQASIPAVNQAIDESALPPEEKKEIKVEVERFFTEFREGRVSTEQFGQMIERFAHSPLMSAIVTSAIETKYLDASGLSDEEKADAKTTLQRFMRGVIDDKIAQPAADAALSHVATKQPNNQWEFPDKVTDEQIRAFVVDAKKAADEAGIPAEPEEFDPSDEVKRIIDETLNGPVSPPPPMQAPPPTKMPDEPVAGS